MEFPAAFRANMTRQLGEQADAFFGAHDRKPPTSIFLNRRKCQRAPFQQLSPVPWCEAGFYLPERPNFTYDPLFHAGGYYVMDASTMLFWHVFKSAVQTIRDAPLRVLDLCAAPGGKSIMAASLLGPEDLLVSNEVIRSRYDILRLNLIKWGYPNVLCCQKDPAAFRKTYPFDIVIVDAPCSGEGMFRKDPGAISQWSQDAVRHCSRRQQRILRDSLALVRPGGFILYSTCTYNKSENSNQVQWIMDNAPFEVALPKVDPDWGIETTGQPGPDGYQCYPHKLNGEGFFISLLKKSTAIPPQKEPHQQRRKMRSKADQKDFRKISARQDKALRTWLAHPGQIEFRVNRRGHVFLIPKALLAHGLPQGTGCAPGVPAGQWKGEIFVPAHALALSELTGDHINRIAVDHETAIRFLKKERIEATVHKAGWHLICYGGLGIGWVKATRGGMKNYLPTRLRIIK